MRKTQALLLFLATLFCFPVLANGQINVGIRPDPFSVAPGSTATFDIVLSPSAGETFDALTLAFAVGDGGSATGSPQDGDNLLITNVEFGAIFDGTDFTATITTGGVGQSAVLINFNLADVSNNILADGVVATITVDSSSANLSDSFVLNPNVLEATAAFDNGTPLAISSSTTTLQVGQSVLLGDANRDGVVNFLDINPFIALLTFNVFLAEADINQDGAVNFLDIDPFIDALVAE